jgi:large subunit ribosomal protein L15
MDHLSHLHSITNRPKKRVGRGHGSGKVKTSGRGTKGQNARGHMPQGFEGGQLSILKRLPLLRGKGRNRSQKGKAYPISINKLMEMPAGTIVSLETLKKYHIIDSVVAKVKILGSKPLNQKLTVQVPCSKSARVSIEKAGGSVSQA